MILGGSYSPASFGGEGISGASETEGHGELPARLGGWADFSVHEQHPPGGVSQLVFPASGCVREVVQDGPMDHRSVSRQHKEQRLSGQGTQKRVKMSGRASRRFAELIYSHKRRQRREGVDGGMAWNV